MRPDWLAGFVFNEATGACWSVEVGGVLFFCCYFRPLHDSLVTESCCSGNDGAGKLLWGIKTWIPVFSWWQLSFLVILSANANANMLSASRWNRGKKFTGCNRPIRRHVTKLHDWFALVNKYFRGKIMRTSLPLTEIWPISDRFIKQKHYCITVHYRTVCTSDKLSKLDSKLSDIWNYFRTMSDGRRQTESLYIKQWRSRSADFWWSQLIRIHSIFHSHNKSILREFVEIIRKQMSQMYRYCCLISPESLVESKKYLALMSLFIEQRF